MDPATVAMLAQTTSALLVPHLRKLLQSAPAAGDAHAASTVEGGALARALWETLRPRLEARPDVARLVHALATPPPDAEAMNVFRKELRRLLIEDPALAADVASALQHEQGGRTGIVGSGQPTVARTGSATGSFIVTGDATRVKGP